MKFTCIGFDIREWPAPGRLTTELDDWERSNDLYQKALNELQLQENSYQIIEVNNNDELQRLINFTRSYDFANLLAISFSDSLVQISPRKSCDTSELNLNNFITRGYDVCDFNGFYSFSELYTPKEQLNQFGLFSENNLVWALESMQLTQFNDPDHCPVVIAKLSTLK
jgi:hypothetical protein